MGFRSVWPWRASEKIALAKNILSTLEPFPSRVRTGGGGLDLTAVLAANVPPVRLKQRECDTLQRFPSS